MLPETGRSSILMQRCSQSQRAFGLEKGKCPQRNVKLTQITSSPMFRPLQPPTSSLEPGSLSDHFLLSLPSGKS